MSDATAREELDERPLMQRRLAVQAVRRRLERELWPWARRIEGPAA